MYAAAEGKSRLGIPKAVGEEFITADAINGHAAGILYVAPDGDVLLLRRASTETNYAGHWALPGGGGEEGETPEQTADREAHEEMGMLIPESATAMKLLDSRVTPTGKAFHTFAQSVPSKFVPQLNDEHTGYAWCPLNMLPGPMHPAVMETLTNRLGVDAELTPEDWAMLRIGFVNWVNAEEQESQIMGAMDKIAMDRSVRRIDADGHMFVEETPISKANICPYYGREIPNASGLGLDPDRIYQMYRDPEELAMAAQSFAGKPILIIHKPVSAEEHPREIVVGSIGSNVGFKAPYLMASLNIWDGEAIDLIEADKQKELSCGYRYEADMTPGIANGQRFDGVMRNIGGNHLALVVEGRAGPDVVVGDEAIKREKEPDMAKKIAAHAARSAALTAALTGVLAQDAKIEDVVKKLLAIDEDLPKNAAEDEDMEDDQEAMDEEEDKDKKAEDESEEDDDKKAEDEDKEEMVSKKAMDAALVSVARTAASQAEKSTIARLNSIRDAEEAVRPYVGKVVAMDSADAIYRSTLTSMNVDVSDVKELPALKAILKAQPLPGANIQRTTKVAMDAKGASSFFELYPEAKSHPVKTL